MNLKKQVTLLVIAVVATAMLAVGLTAAVTAGASTGGSTYFACVKSGKLIDVGVAAPSCPGGTSQISWNSQGSPGPTGAQGPVGQASVVNVAAASAFASDCPEPPAPSDPSTQPSGGINASLSIPGVTDMKNGVSTPDAPIHLLSWSSGVAGPGEDTSCAAGRSATGQGASGLEFSVVKDVDQSSPVLFASAASGNHYPTATLSVRKSGASQDYLTYTFSTVFVTKVQWAHEGEGNPTEEVTFQYGKLGVSCTPQNSDGSYGTAIQTCFDINLQLAC